MTVAKTLDYAAFGNSEPLPTPVLGAASGAKVIAIGSTATVTASKIGGTVAIISCTADCYLSWGDDAPTATTSSMVLPKGLWVVAFSADVKLSALKITGGSDGVLSVIPALGS